MSTTKNIFMSILGIGLLSYSSISIASNNLNTFKKSWTGTFGERKIGVFIQSINHDTISGYSVLGGVKSPFSGKIIRKGNTYLATAVEKNNAKSDGTFHFILKLDTPNEITGQWIPNAANLEIRNFSLQNQQCGASPTHGDYATSIRVLADDELQVPKRELAYMRNEIYARHGYSFKNREVENMFSVYSWYMPCYTDVTTKLTPIEKKNIDRIQKAEAYASDIDWGR